MQELVPGGVDVAVTNANKLLYIHLVADWHLNGRLGAAAAAFAAGLAQACCLCFSVLSVLTAPKHRRRGRAPATFFCSEGWQAFFHDTQRPEPFVGSGVALGVLQPFTPGTCSGTITAIQDGLYSPEHHLGILPHKIADRQRSAQWMV